MELTDITTLRHFSSKVNISCLIFRIMKTGTKQYQFLYFILFSFFSY